MLDEFVTQDTEEARLDTATYPQVLTLLALLVHKYKC
jgi:hypothetical protein